MVFSKNGDEAFWTEWIESETGYSQGCNIWHSQINQGYWSVPAIFLKYGDTPVFSTDNRFLYCLHTEFTEGTRRRETKIIRYTKVDGGYSLKEDVSIDLTKNGLYWQFTFDSNENIYFGGHNGLCVSEFGSGKYLPHKKIIEEFHPQYDGETPFISLDGSYLIFGSEEIPGAIGEIDLYIGFKKKDGTWTEPINMGHEINTPEIDFLPMVSPDGEYFFFCSTRNNISGKYWVSADIIEKLKPKELK
ncbi:MAG: hypothetical protein K8R58_13550 [Bacteroidales bacterium]|nr:hypothetical protein [Bacteroidales bacterium]